MRLSTKFSALALALAATAGTAFGQDLQVIGKPIQGAIDFQPAATEVARELQGLSDMILIIITGIVLFVTALMVYAFIRFNRRANPTPARFSHHTPVEVAWTLVPILILLFIGSFSLPVLFKQQTIPEADVTVKVTGFQWAWNYEYVGEDVTFDSFMLERDQLTEFGYTDSDYLLATDTAIVLPVGKTVVMQVTASDVIHSWTIPAFGVKQDAVPGRIAQLWFKPEVEGIFYGQCSELCGKNHAFMPITVKVVSQPVYDQWLAAAKAGDVQLQGKAIRELASAN
jgi:cytochrome c oxidase subunit II